MKLTTTNRELIEEVPFGTYVFRCADGSYMGDGEGRLMCILGMKGDREKVKKLYEAAKHYNKEEAEMGEVEFWSGQRPVSDEEYDEQLARQDSGLIADPLDVGAYMDAIRKKSKTQLD